MYTFELKKKRFGVALFERVGPVTQHRCTRLSKSDPKLQPYTAGRVSMLGPGRRLALTVKCAYFSGFPFPSIHTHMYPEHAHPLRFRNNTDQQPNRGIPGESNNRNDKPEQQYASG